MAAVEHDISIEQAERADLPSLDVAQEVYHRRGDLTEASGVTP